MVITTLLVSLSSTDMTLLYATMHSNGLTFCNFTIDWETLAAFSEYLNLNDKKYVDFFMFSKKATEFDNIFTVDLTLCSKCQIDGEDIVNFYGLL